MRGTTTPSRAVRVGLLATILLASVAASAAGQSQGPAGEMQAATLRLDWVPTGYHAPFFLAAERGYYADAGIDLEILDGQGSGTAIQLVGAGSETFGLASLATMALGVGEGVPVRAIAGMLQRMPEGVISVAEKGIDEPADVAGLRMGYTAGSSGEALFPAFAEVNGIDADSVQQITVEPAAKVAGLLLDQYDFIVDWPFTRGPIMEAQGATPAFVYYADHGVNVLGHGLIASDETIASRPDLVRGFVEASMRGIDEAVADPEAAVDAMIAQRPDIAEQRDLQLAQMEGLAAHLHTPATEGQPTGWMADSDWAETVRLLTEYMGLQGAPDPAALYTNEFIAPPA